MPGLTTPDSLPYPLGDDEAAPLDEWITDLAVAVQAALADSAWISLGVPSGLTGDVKYRTVLRVVHIDIDVSGSLSGDVQLSAGNLPAGSRPVGTLATGPLYGDPVANRYNLVGYVSTAGGVRAAVTAGTTRVRGRITYLAG